jgi:hypothetical protein
MSIYLCLLVALIGVLMYALCTNGKLVEIGRLLFAAGMSVFLLCYTCGGRVVNILR